MPKRLQHVFSLRSIVAALVTAVALSAPCAAQPCIPAEIARKQSLTDADRAAIKECVDRHAQALSGTAIEISKSRRALSELLRDPAATVPFRLEMARVLMPTLRRNSAGENEDAAINALLLAGNIATADAAELVRRALADARPPVRYAAACGIERSVIAALTQAPALDVDQLKSMTTALGDAMKKETDVAVLDGLILALQSATQVDASRFAGVRDAAVSILSREAADKARQAKSEDSIGTFGGALRRAGEAVRNALIDRQRGELAPKTLVEAGNLAGNLLGLVSARVRDGSLTEDSRAELSLIAAVAEKSYYFAGTSLGATVVDRGLNEMLVREKDEEFLRAVDDIQATLTKPPFSLPQTAFNRQ